MTQRTPPPLAHKQHKRSMQQRTLLKAVTMHDNGRLATGVKDDFHQRVSRGDTVVAQKRHYQVAWMLFRKHIAKWHGCCSENTLPSGMDVVQKRARLGGMDVVQGGLKEYSTFKHPFRIQKNSRNRRKP
jgi:hypothetical protein